MGWPAAGCVLPALGRSRRRSYTSRRAGLTLQDGSEASDLLRGGIDTGTGPRPLPFGVNSLVVEDTRVLVSSPPRPRPLQPYSWGIFAPAYALWDDEPPLGGTLGSARLGEFAGALGASYLATLPLLADYATADAARLRGQPLLAAPWMWWNEAYLDLTRVDRLDAGSFPPPGPIDTGDPGHADVAGAAKVVRAALAGLVAAAHPRPARRHRLRAVPARATGRVALWRLPGRRPTCRHRSRELARAMAGRGHSHRGRRRHGGGGLHVCAQWLTDDRWPLRHAPRRRQVAP